MNGDTGPTRTTRNGRASSRRAPDVVASRRGRMPADDADADVDVDDVVRLAKARLTLLHGIQRIAHASASDDVEARRAREEALAAWTREASAPFDEDVVADRVSLAALKCAFCAVERDGGWQSWTYGVEWLSRAERESTRRRVRNGSMKIPSWFLKSACEFEVVEEGDVWMTFERAAVVVGKRRAREVRDGFALVPKSEAAETYAAHVERDIREDCERTLRRMRAWLATGEAPRAFDPKNERNALREIRTWQPDPSELPEAPTPRGTNLAERRRERRRRRGGVAGVAHHAIAIEADAAEGGRGRGMGRPGEEWKRALAAITPRGKRSASRPFPPCMRNKLEDLRVKAHLRYTDRFQLNLFFKGVGFTVNEALEFWRRGVFPRGRMGDYQREHTYAIRHHYGLEGAMKDYDPHKCESLGKAGVEIECACPFVGTVEDFRRASSARDWFSELSVSGRAAVESAVQVGDPTTACARAFADAHGGMDIAAELTHPADYFDASMEIEELYRDRARRAAFERSAAARADDASTADAVDADDGLPQNIRLDVDDSSSDEDAPS